MRQESGPDLPGREPDLLYAAKEHLSRLRSVYLEGPADLVVEIVSPDSRRRDRIEKLAEYERAGVPKYWIVDPERREAEFHQLDSGGAYRRVPPDAEGVYRSRVLEGLWLRAAWLWQDPLPSHLKVLRELGVL